MIELGDRLELRNDGDGEVVVLGYDGEPYLRVGPGGVYRNARSPATFLNEERRPTEAPPDTYDAQATPEWVRISDGRVARWHDHRAHWMGSGPPPAVREDPDRRHVVIEGWEVTLAHEGGRSVVTGDVVWVPGPSPWPWVAGALAIAAAVVILARTRWWPGVLAATLALLVVIEAVHVVGLWGASSAPAGSKLVASSYSLLGIGVGVGALVVLLRRDPWDAVPALLVAGVFLFVAGGLSDVTSLTRSQLPTTLSPGTARAGVAATLGLGGGLVAGAAMHLRPPVPVARPAAVTE
ncbi:MAG: hypothetical protein M5U14_15560 [Acidimicrobiia bacterium]|nr:hypothetical protein [Acidimicrobiia bacterium]